MIRQGSTKNINRYSRGGPLINQRANERARGGRLLSGLLRMEKMPGIIAPGHRHSIADLEKTDPARTGIGKKRLDECSLFCFNHIHGNIPKVEQFPDDTLKAIAVNIAIRFG